jgi:transcriptional regulator with XRE-family HTH domain
MTIEEKFGSTLRAFRLEKGMSQEELSFQCDLHRTYIGSVERGERNLSLKNIVALCKALNISTIDFFNEYEKLNN